MKAKIRKWNAWRHGGHCIGCTLAFQCGDSVVEVGCLTIHYRRECAERYIENSRELGIEPGIEIVTASRAH